MVEARCLEVPGDDRYQKRVKGESGIMRRSITTTLALVVLVCLAAAIPAVAYGLGSPSSLSVTLRIGTTPLAGVDIAISQVAHGVSVPNGIQYTATDDYATFPIDFLALGKSSEADAQTASELLTYAQTHALPLDPATSDPSGVVHFTDLAPGLYLVAQVNTTTTRYRIAPYLVPVPVMNPTTKEIDYEVASAPKAEPYEIPITYLSLRVSKVWANSSTSTRPASISVQLYRDDLAYGSPVILSADNAWRHTWQNLDDSYTYRVDEPTVPANHVKTVSGNARDGFTITNEYRPPADPPGPFFGLPITGDTLRWIASVALATGAGAVLIVIALAWRRRREQEHQT
jgi:hypothetical protein